MEEMNANFNDPGSTPPASGVPEFLNLKAVGTGGPADSTDFTVSH